MTSSLRLTDLREALGLHFPSLTFDRMQVNTQKGGMHREWYVGFCMFSGWHFWVLSEDAILQTPPCVASLEALQTQLSWLFNGYFII